MTRHLRIAFVLIAFVPASLLAWSDGGEVPKHLVVARDMVSKIDLSKTSYKNGTGRVSFAEPIECHTDCSGFLNYLLKHTYDYNDDQLQKWFSAKRPQASHYHQAIIKENGFKQITLIKDALPGDMMAIKYLVRKDHTGHAMLVSGAPKKRTSTNPLVQYTEQWEVKVIDAFLSHGPTDARYRKGNDDRDHGGLGEGILRVYSDKDGKIAGYSWSTLTTSMFVEPSKEHLVIGRLKEEYAVAQGGKVDPVGTWKCEYEIGDQKRTSTLTIKKDGDKLAGTMSWPDQKETNLKDVKLKDKDLTFSAVRVFMENEIPIDYKLTIDGDKLKGKGSSDFGGQKTEFDIMGKREKKDK